ncbi:MAG: hypothetical protein R3F59_11770 [Myxococcota bacterium]
MSGTDFGVDLDDNLPFDVFVGDGVHVFGADASFVCTRTTCTE